MASEDTATTVDNKHVVSDKVRWVGYISLLFAVLFFSGIFHGKEGAISVLDYSTIVGKFGVMGEDSGINYRGVNGFGVREGFLFALGIVPGMMLALGVINVIDHLGGLDAARKLLTPVLRPLMGIPGVASLALITSLQSTDGGAAMTRALVDENRITQKERAKFMAFQFSAGSAVDNFLSTGSALFAFTTVPILIPFALIFVLKVFGANLMRLYLKRFKEEDLL